MRLQQALTNKPLLGQLNGEPPGDLLQLIILQQKHQCFAKSGPWTTSGPVDDP